MIEWLFNTPEGTTLLSAAPLLLGLLAYLVWTWYVEEWL
jgi:hypothetical protein